MRKIIALCCVVALLVCIVPPSSAATDANIVISNVEPTELLAGETKELTLTITNAGSNDAKRITLNFKSSQYISVVGSSSVSVGSLNGWSSKDITITVHAAKGTPGGTYAIPVNCTFDQYYTNYTQAPPGGSPQVVTETEHMPEVSYSIVLKVAQGAIIEISDITPSELEPGEEAELKFTITNKGNSPLDNLLFSWTEPKGVILPVNSDNSKFIDHIGVGASAVVEYLVAADVTADAGVYQLYLTLEFADESRGLKLINTTAGIVIGGGTDFDVVVSESSSGQTSLSVANTGNNPAYSVTVRIPEQRQFRVQDSNASIVGNLDKGDYTIVSFQITSTNASFATHSNNLCVAIDYTDATGVRRTVEKAVPIQSMGMSSEGTQLNLNMRQQQSIWKNLTLIGTIALVILLIVGFIYYKKRKTR